MSHDTKTAQALPEESHTGKSGFRKKLEQGKFVFTVEAHLPKGTDLTEVMQNAKLLRGAVDAYNIPDNTRSVMKIGGIGVCRLLLEEGFEPIWQVACKDRNQLALQSDLLSGWVLGIRNVLALTGDPPQVGDHPNAKKVFEFESVKLIKLIHNLNAGFDEVGNRLKGSTNYFVGATFNPNYSNQDRAIRKAGAGAKFFQSQLVFDPQKFVEESAKIRGTGAKILAGIIPLQSAKMAHFVAEKVPGVKVPEEIIREIESSHNQEKTGIEIARRTISEIRKHCDGIHVMPLKRQELVLELVD